MDNSNAIVPVEDLKLAIQAIQQVMAQVMINGEHYGRIAGCGPKPALLKPGAEKILATFRIRCKLLVEDLSTGDAVRYRVTARGVLPDGTFVGDGIGECSSDENKYRWRQVIHKKEWDETPETRRRHKWTRDGKCTNQVRTEPADVANTVLKMAAKRAKVDLCLSSTACSDIFAQDIDEVEPEPRKRKKSARSDEEIADDLNGGGAGDGT